MFRYFVTRTIYWSAFFSIAFGLLATHTLWMDYATRQTNAFEAAVVQWWQEPKDED
jgi:hypothetical protein